MNFSMALLRVKWTENVNQTHLVFVSGTLVLQKIALPLNLGMP